MLLFFSRFSVCPFFIPNFHSPTEWFLSKRAFSQFVFAIFTTNSRHFKFLLPFLTIFIQIVFLACSLTSCLCVQVENPYKFEFSDQPNNQRNKVHRNVDRKRETEIAMERKKHTPTENLSISTATASQIYQFQQMCSLCRYPCPCVSD